MLIINLLLTVSGLFNSSCWVVSDTISSRCYRDINYYKLEGISELRPNELNQFPYFEIVEVNPNKRLIIFKYTTTNSDTSIYERKKKYWFSLGERKESYQHTFLYEYVFEDQILILEYFYDYNLISGQDIPEDLVEKTHFTVDDHLLSGFTLITDRKRTDYGLNKRLKIKPSPFLEKRLRKMKYSAIFETTFSVADTVLIEEDKQVYPLEEDNLVDKKICYSLIDQWGYKHNTFWPKFLLTKVACK